MKLATRRNGTRDGELIVVSRDGSVGTSAQDIAPTLQSALDHWAQIKPKLEQLSRVLHEGSAPKKFTVKPEDLHSPLPRAYAWCDGSTYINHTMLVRKARGAELPPTIYTDPLMYQGGSDTFIGPREPILCASEDYGIDLEAEIAVITTDVPMECRSQEASKYIALIMLCNDVSLRNLVPDELAKGFGFFQSKPSSAFSPFAVTPDELGAAWKDSRVYLPVESQINGKWFGNPDAGPEMHFSFSDLIAHAAKTRALGAGTIVGSGTVSNKDRSKGSSCLAEKRMIEKIESGSSTTSFLKFGDTVTIDMKLDGCSVCGSIHQKVVRYERKS